MDAVIVENQAVATRQGIAPLVGAFIGFFVDTFDIMVPLIAIAPAMSYFQPPNLPMAVQLSIFYFTIYVTFLARPIGAFIFGHIGDKIGRKKSVLLAGWGFSIATLLLGVIPGYQIMGIGSIVVFTTLRLINGIFLGGEYTGASPLALEYAPKQTRGFRGALINSGYPACYVVLSIITSICLATIPHGSPTSPYSQWGWRIPFFVGFIFSAAFVVYVYKKMPESELWEKTVKSKAPLKELFQGQNFRNLSQVFLLMSGVFFLGNLTTGTLPGALMTIVKFSSYASTNILLFVNAILFFCFLLAGIIGQRFGRKKTLMGIGALGAVFVTISYYSLVNLGPQSLIGAFLLATVIIVLGMSAYGVVTAYITERFSTNVRSSGYGIGYSLAMVLPSFYSFIMLWMSRAMPYKYTELPLIVVAGILMIVGAAIGPETKDVDF